MWDLPIAGIKPVSSAFAGGFLTTGPPEKSHINFFKCPSGVLYCFQSRTWTKTTPCIWPSCLLKVKVLVAKSCPPLCNPMDCSPPAPLSMEFPRQEYWSRLPCPSPGDLPDPGIKPRSPALQADSLPSEPPRRPALSPGCLLIWHSYPASPRPSWPLKFSSLSECFWGC